MLKESGENYSIVPLLWGIGALLLILCFEISSNVFWGVNVPFDAAVWVRARGVVREFPDVPTPNYFLWE